MMLKETTKKDFINSVAALDIVKAVQDCGMGSFLIMNTAACCVTPSLAVWLDFVRVQDAQGFLQSRNLVLSGLNTLLVRHPRIHTSRHKLFVNLEGLIQKVSVQLQVCHLLFDGGLGRNDVLLVQRLRHILARVVRLAAALELHVLCRLCLLLGRGLLDRALEVGLDDLKNADDTSRLFLPALVRSFEARPGRVVLYRRILK